MSVNGFSPTQTKILRVLSDGMPHSRHELHACLDDPLSNLKALWFHICMMRKTLRPKGEDIICEYCSRSYYYRHVRLLSGGYDSQSTSA